MSQRAATFGLRRVRRVRPRIEDRGSRIADRGSRCLFYPRSAILDPRSSIGAAILNRTTLLCRGRRDLGARRSEEHTSELQSRPHLVCRLLLEKKKKNKLPLPLAKKKKTRKNEN